MATIEAPTFVINSALDMWQTWCIFTSESVNERSYLLSAMTRQVPCNLPGFVVPSDVVHLHIRVREEAALSAICYLP